MALLSKSLVTAQGSGANEFKYRCNSPGQDGVIFSGAAPLPPRESRSVRQ